MSRRASRLKTISTPWKVLWTVVMVLVSSTMILPFLWMLSSSFKDSVSMFNYPIEWIPRKLDFSGYVTVWKGEANFGLFFLNSLKVTALSVAGTLLSCTLGGYAYAKIRFTGRDAIFLAKLATMIIPSQVTMLPTFMIFKWLGLLNTHAALWIPFFLGQPFGTFLMRQYFLKVPEELIDSGKIDGAGHPRIFLRIALPLVQAGTSVLAFLYCVWAWNYYEGPLLYIRSVNLYTLPLALKYYTNEFATNYTAVMAASVCMTLPVIVIFLSLQRFFIEDIASTGLKG